MTNDVQGRALRVLIVSQSASEFGVRKICEALSLHSGVRVRALGPRRGYYPLGGRVVETPRSSHGAYDLVNGRVYRAMADFSNPYLTGLLREVLRFRPDVIQVFNEAYSGVHAQAVLYRNLFRPGALCFSTGAQNVIPRRVKSKREQFKRRFAHRHVDGVACWSTGAKQALIEAGFPSPRLAVTHWGVPLEAFFPARNDARREAMGAARDFVLGYVGRIELQKGLWTLLLAMRRLPSSVKCLCIGDGRWGGSFDAKLHEFGLADRVIRVPTVPGEAVPSYLNAMDALVLPSESTTSLVEQFGRVLPEAMACEVPVIGSDSGAIPEVIGDAGMVFVERDFVQLADCVQRLAADAELRRKLGRAGRERAAALFSCEAFAQRLLALYRRTPSRRERGRLG